MTNAGWRVLRERFDEVIQLAPAARERFVATLRAEDPLLATRLQELLEAVEASEGRLEPPAFGRPAVDEPDLVAGARIGAYLLGPRVATGGMGVVFEAEQQNPRRKVALKMLRLGFDSPEAARRFRDEAELLARLRHPGIAQVFEAGVHQDGDQAERPWFAMEFVEGATDLVTFCRRGDLSRDACLGLFAEICDAVQHGHQRGIVHRDLKPANLLVDQAGRPKVIDFGVACSTDADRHRATLARTRVEIVGTLRYMSPEQLAGRTEAVDTRTDVHALGVVLFELLTGFLPYDLDDKSLLEIARIVCDEPPRRPSTLGVAGDLEWIVLKAIAKRPADRYASVAELAEDVRRYLRQETISARPPSLAYHLRTFARRHRALTAAVMLVLIAAITATIVSADAAIRARRAEAVATTQVARTQRLLDELLGVSVTMADDFVRRLDPKFASLELRRDLARTAVDTLESVAAQAEGDARILVSVARAHLEFAKVAGDPERLALGDLDAANRSFARAHEIAVQLAESDPEDRAVQLLLADTTRSTAARAARDDRREESIRLYERSIAILEALDGRAALVPSERFAIANALRGLGMVHAQGGDWAAASAAFERALPVVDRVARDEPDRKAWRIECTLFRDLIASMTGRLGDTAQAIANLTESCAEKRRVLAEDPSDDRLWNLTIGAEIELARHLTVAGEFDRAEALLRGVIPEIERTASAHPLTPNVRRKLVAAHDHLGRVLMARPPAGIDDGARILQLRAARDAFAAGVTRAAEIEGRGESDPYDATVHRELREQLRAVDEELARLGSIGR